MRWLVLFVFDYRPGSSLQNQIYKTVQMTRTMNAAQVPQAVYLCFFVLMYSPLEKSFLSSTDLWH